MGKLIKHHKTDHSDYLTNEEKEYLKEFSKGMEQSIKEMEEHKRGERKLKTAEQVYKEL